jgi:hypothetical protein
MLHTPPRLTREQAAEFLTGEGFPITRRYLAKLSIPSSGQGPRVDLWFGGRALYRPEDLIAWAESRACPGSPQKAVEEAA